MRILKTLVVGFLLLLAYFLFLPVPIEPVAFESIGFHGYTGDFQVNNQLANLKKHHIADEAGPEDIAIDSKGLVYVSTHHGWIVRLTADLTSSEKWVNTKGRPLGLAFDHNDNLIIADAYRGLLKIDQQKVITELTKEAGDTKIAFANNVDIADNGNIYFSDASTKFGASEWGGSYPASLLDLMEHGGHGRLLMYSPGTQKTSVLYSGLNFANGVALSHDQQSVLINETGSYRVLRYWLYGEKSQTIEVVIDELPAFPDNLNRGKDGRYWLGLVSPRNSMLDGLSDKPFVRKIIQRFPAFIRPKATYYGHVIAIDNAGRVVMNLQDPSGEYATNTTAIEAGKHLLIGSLLAEQLASMKNPFYVSEEIKPNG
jgi:sugar lactone lactonase YvrE